MGLSRKIYVVFGFLLFMLGIIATVGLVNISLMRSASNSLFEEAFYEARYFTELKSELEHSQRLLLNIMIEPDLDIVKEEQEELEVASRLVDSKLAYILLDGNDLDPEARLSIVQLRDGWQEYKALRGDLIAALVSAKSHGTQGGSDSVLESPLWESFKGLIALAGGLVELEKEEISQANRLVVAKYDNMIRLYILLIVFGAISMVVMLIYLLRSIIGRIKTLGNAMQQVEGGRLDCKIEAEGLDELGDLMRSFNWMARQVYESHVNQEQVKMILQWNSQEMEAKNIRLDKSNKELQNVNKNIEQTREQIAQSEKMASVGQLAADIADEINNPVELIGKNLYTLGTYLRNINELIRLYRQVGKALNENDFDAASLLTKKIDSFTKVNDMDLVLKDLDPLVYKLKEGADRVVSIVSRLEEFASYGEGDMIQTDINRCLENVIKVVGSECKHKVTIEKDLGELPAVTCCSQQIAQVLFNILFNATQSVKDEGTIRVRTYAEGDDVFIEVGDDGEGMAEGERRGIFNASDAAEEGGSGFDLSRAHGIIKDHNGEIDLRSKPGEGAVITVRLPKEVSAGTGQKNLMDRSA